MLGGLESGFLYGFLFVNQELCIQFNLLVSPQVGLVLSIIGDRLQGWMFG